MSNDLTNKVTSYHQLQLSKERLELVLEGTRLGMWDWNPQTNEVVFDERWANMLGLHLSELTQTLDDWQSRVHPDDIDGCFKDITAHISGHIDFYENTHRMMHKDGNWRYILDRGRVMERNEQGDAVRFTGTHTDVTALKLAELKAEEANLAKSEFLSSISHELRTPLNAILGFGQMLEFNPNEVLTANQKLCVNHILKGGKHLLTLINDILDLSQIESGEISLSLEDIKLFDILHDCQLFIKPLADKRGIEIILPKEKTEKISVHADYTRLKQVLLNLLSNAVKYNNEHGKIIIHFEKQPDDMLHIAITDTGEGISKIEQRQLFKAFSRLNAKNSKIEGSGIGLILSLNLIEIMGGSIGFDSEVGLGSTFWIKIPLSNNNNNETLVAQPLSETVNTKVLPKIVGTLLYIEDNPANLELMKLIVCRIEGLTLLSATTGEQGLELIKTEKPDVIIIDINLPDISGFAVLNELKLLDGMKNRPILALSADVTKAAIQKGIDAGFCQYLAKPIKIPVIVDAIKQVMKQVNG